MFNSPTKSEYVPLTSQLDGEPTDRDRNDDADEPTAPTPAIPAAALWACLAVACLSVFNIALLPATLSATPRLSDSQLAALPYPDQRLGLDRAAAAMPTTPAYLYEWPTHIARLSQKLKNAVYGSGSQVFISVEDSTLIRFRVPANGTNACAITWHPPPELGIRKADLDTKGDVTEIEVWSIIAPNPAVPGASLDFDTLSWNTRPVQGELLGTLDLTARPNATTVPFACPGPGVGELVVELRCLRVACYVQFLQVPFIPKMGFELVRRQ